MLSVINIENKFFLQDNRILEELDSRQSIGNSGIISSTYLPTGTLSSYSTMNSKNVVNDNTNLFPLESCSKLIPSTVISSTTSAALRGTVVSSHQISSTNPSICQVILLIPLHFTIFNRKSHLISV